MLLILVCVCSFICLFVLGVVVSLSLSHLCGLNIFLYVFKYVCFLWAKARATMLFCKCSSFLDSSGGDYNFMGNIFAQFPISHKFSFTFYVCVFVFSFQFFIVLTLSLRKCPKGLSFFMSHFCFYVTVYSEQDGELSRLWNGECDLYWPQNCYVIGPDSEKWACVYINNMHVYAEWMCLCGCLRCDCWFLVWWCEKWDLNSRLRLLW